MSNTNYSDLPFRPGVGMMIIDNANRIFVGKRVDTRIEAWQMPQGGIDIGETPSRAAMREMKEEIGCNDGYIMAETKNWYSYDLPKFLIPKLWNGNYRGQKQKWFLIKFTGKEEDINISAHSPEFSEWRWTTIQELPEIIVPFKRKLYLAVAEEFKRFLI